MFTKRYRNVRQNIRLVLGIRFEFERLPSARLGEVRLNPMNALYGSKNDRTKSKRCVEILKTRRIERRERVRLIKNI